MPPGAAMMGGMRIPALACAALLSVVALQDPASRPAKGPQVGQAAPAFVLNDHNGSAVAVGGKADTWTVLAFYPKAMTPG